MLFRMFLFLLTFNAFEKFVLKILIHFFFHFFFLRWWKSSRIVHVILSKNLEENKLALTTPQIPHKEIVLTHEPLMNTAVTLTTTSIEIEQHWNFVFYHVDFYVYIFNIYDYMHIYIYMCGIVSYVVYIPIKLCIYDICGWFGKCNEIHTHR